MKRLLILCLCLLLLTGCLAEPQTPPDPTVPETTAPAAPSLPPERPGVPLLEQGASYGKLLYIPNPHVESMSCPEIRLHGNGLLLYEHTAEGLQLKRISLEDGRLLAQASYPVSSAVRVQIGSGLIGLCDSGTGQVLILNDSLVTEKTYTLTQGGDNWYLDQELENLLVFYRERGVVRIHLESGEERWLLEGATSVQELGASAGYVLFSYTDCNDQTTYHRCLSLSVGNLETVPLEDMRSGIRNGEYWLMQQEDAEYILVELDTASAFQWAEGQVELIPGRRQLLMTDGSFRELTLYGLDGEFLSRCVLPQTQEAVVGTDLVWSGYWQGYFFADMYDDAAHLIFWDPSVSESGEDLSLSALGAVLPPEAVMEQWLYERAEALTERFGLQILVAEQCATEYSHYEAQHLTESSYVRLALDLLEETLSAYPEGFLAQLPFGDMQTIRIELVANLQLRENMDYYPDVIGGFAQARSDHYLIVLDGYTLQKGTVYHELSHVIDRRLQWDAGNRHDALFSEETWLSLQPQGFRFAESYTDVPTELQRFENSGYFVKAYSMTFATEDRATLMELAMTDPAAVYGQPGMAEKMRYYAACIRDCFQTEGWPDQTLWE